MSLKAAAKRVIERNRTCNSRTTGPATERNSSATGDELAIRDWLDHIGESDPELIYDVLEKCRTNCDALKYFLWRAEVMPE